MLAGQLALIAAALFTGAAFYINFAEQPARLELDLRSSLLEWKRAYGRGFVMQLSLVVAGFLLGMLAWSELDNVSWLVGALVMALNIPYTLSIIAPVNAKLEAIDPASPPPESRGLLAQWGSLHAVRTAIGFAATLVFLQGALS
jgi:Anthrone oxygenase